MCGIAVIVAKNRPFHSMSDPLRRMLERMRHRGPDGRGFIHKPGVDMGMVRLAIVDVGGGDQPIWNEDHTLALICNGEIYNADELRTELTECGHRFATGTDIEVILHLYEEMGAQCTTRLEGIFALAIWDNSRGALFVARDRMGVKPLYYADLGSHWAFASEFQAFSVVLDEPAVWDEQALLSYHTFRFTPLARTLDPRIQRVLPAHSAEVLRGQLKCEPYWKPKFAIPKKNSHPRARPSSAGTLRKLIVAAVSRQEAKEVKSAVLLSGGLDSTALLAIRRQFTDNAPDTAITVAFERPHSGVRRAEYSEIRQAMEVARKFQSNHLIEIISGEEALQALPQIVADLDEPIADPTAIPLWFAARMAKKQGCKVVYSGEGLDELFAGYSVYGQAAWLQALQRVPRPLRQSLHALLLKLNGRGTGVLDRSLQETSDWYQGVGGVFTPSERSALLTAGRTDQFFALPEETWRMVREGTSSKLQQMLLFDLLTWLPDNTLAKSDKISMAHSIEFRVPYLDRAIVDFALGCPDYKKRNMGGKRVVRRALSGIVPMSAIWRRKIGFTVPISAWLFGEWHEYARSVLLSPSALTRDLYGDRIHALFLAPPAQQERAGRLLFTLLTLELWLTHQTREINAGNKAVCNAL
ncbi:MAG: asparagine synthase (glutamine-hydrolyzing) [Bacilli bacterium]